MYEYASSADASLYVGVYSGTTTDEDYEDCVTSMSAFEKAQRGHALGIAAILVSDPDVPPVPAGWRKRMAAFNESVQASSYLLAIVTPSPIIRGILTAINWLAPPKAGQKRVAHETLAQGSSWIEKQRGRSEPEIAELYRKARGALTKRESA